MDFLVYLLAAIGAVTVLAITVILPGLIILKVLEKKMFVDYNHLMASTPPAVFNFIIKAYRLVDCLPNYVLPPPQRTVDVVMSFVRSQVVMTLTELGVFELLNAKGPLTTAQLSKELGAVPDLLDRLLRSAACMNFLEARPVLKTSKPTSAIFTGVYARAGKSTEMLYSLTNLSATLCDKHPNSVKDFALTMRDQYGAYEQLVECVKSGKPAFDVKAGHSWWRELELNSFVARRFDAGMVALSNLVNAQALVLDYPWSRYEHVVDVGGGTGGFLVPLLTHHKHLRATLFDLPHVIDSAAEIWTTKYPDLKPRLTLASGSFIESTTPGSSSPIPAQDPTAPLPTAYNLRNILHDWDDEHCIKILSHIRNAIGSHPERAVLTVAETGLMSWDRDLEVAKRLSDIHMMAMCNGKERSECEFEELFQQAGFKLNKVVRTRGIFVVVEAVPV